MLRIVRRGESHCAEQRRVELRLSTIERMVPPFGRAGYDPIEERHGKGQRPSRFVQMPNLKFGLLRKLTCVECGLSPRMIRRTHRHMSHELPTAYWPGYGEPRLNPFLTLVCDQISGQRLVGVRGGLTGNGHKYVNDLCCDLNPDNSSMRGLQEWKDNAIQSIVSGRFL